MAVAIITNHTDADCTASQVGLPCPFIYNLPSVAACAIKSSLIHAGWGAYTPATLPRHCSVTVGWKRTQPDQLPHDVSTSAALYSTNERLIVLATRLTASLSHPMMMLLSFNSWTSSIPQ